MLRKFAIGALASLFILGVSSEAIAAKKNSPEINEYLKNAEKQREEEAKKAKQQRKDDPYRKLRPYDTLGEIYAHLDTVVAENPDMFSGGTYGKSVEGRDLRYLKMSTGDGDKPEILITGNIHAQELAGGQMVIALIDYFAEECEDSLDCQRRAENADIYFIPVMNPDGMAKTARIQSKWGITGFIRKNTGGVDLNRNFPYPAEAPDKIKDSAGSPKKRSQTHRGPEPLSEPEAKNFIKFVDQHDFILSINYHTSGGLILYSPGTYPDPEPDTELMKELGKAYQEEQFDPYDVRPGIELYPTIGALDDYLYHHYGILSFTIEVGKDNQDHSMNINSGTWSPIFWMYNVDELEREKANNVPGALAMVDEAIQLYRDPARIKWEPPDVLWVDEPPLSGDSLSVNCPCNR